MQVITNATFRCGKPGKPKVVPLGTRCELSDLAIAEAEYPRYLAIGVLKPAPDELTVPASTESSREERILVATREILAAGGEGLTAEGKPKVEAVEDLLGFDISAEERDAAFEAIQAEQ